MDRIASILSFILENFDKCHYDGGGGGMVSLPDFELMPIDYIEFAGNEIDKNTPESLVNCVGHLKRAIDCQLDRFLHAINLYNLFDKNNLKFDTKFAAIELTGVFHSKSLQLLNTIRNKMEHEYAIPNVKDLQAYYELCNAFILVIESFITMLTIYGYGFEWYDDFESGKIQDATGLYIAFDQERPAITYGLSKKGNEKVIKFVPTNKESTVEYLKALNIFFILCRNDTILSDRHALKLLKALEENNIH